MGMWSNGTHVGCEFCGQGLIDIIGVLKTVMHYGIVLGIEQRKVSWEI